MTPEEDDRDLLAAEFVLGTLDAAQRAAASRLIETDGAFAAAVRMWGGRLLPLVGIVESVVPAPELWRRIEATVDRQSPAARASPVVPRRPGLWSSVGFWRWTTVGAAACAAALAAFVVMRQVPSARIPEYVAVLQVPDGAGVGYIANVYADGSVDLIPIQRPQIAPQQAFELWTKAPAEAAPTSLGVIPVGEVVHIPADRFRAFAPEQMFAISLEAATGSQTGAPAMIEFLGLAVDTP
jgi:anti-sigma-K factor RskA